LARGKVAELRILMADEIFSGYLVKNLGTLGPKNNGGSFFKSLTDWWLAEICQRSQQ
jgi:hypothetical protein